jgi:predicted AlkP superfamily phosphohydrolase/phosphomutase
MAEVALLDKTKINKRMTIIALEGLNFDFLIPLINEGKLPNFSWLMEEGSWGKLAAFTPSEPLIFNSSFNTGKMPAKHRQLSTLKYQLLNLDREIEVVPRFIFFRQLTRIGLLLYRSDEPTPITKDIWTVFEENNTPYVKKDWPYREGPQESTSLVDTLFEMYYKDLKYETDPIMDLLKNSFYADCAYEYEANTAIKDNQSELSYFMLNGLNIVERYFYKYSFPSLFGDIDQEDIAKYGTVIERYYQFYDRIISKYLASLKENELLVVYSPHSIEVLPLWKRFVEFILGNATISAYHDNAPEGVVFFYGKEIARSKNIEGIRLIDIAPTLLYYLGLHVGLDMDGVVRTFIFRDDFRAENPVSYIRTYDQVTIK